MIHMAEAGWSKEPALGDWKKYIAHYPRNHDGRTGCSLVLIMMDQEPTHSPADPRRGCRSRKARRVPPP
jgi:hypothetical protein